MLQLIFAVAEDREKCIVEEKVKNKVRFGAVLAKQNTSAPSHFS
ncbi:hypothetical protein [Labilibaculum manganireducens]|nr:hypothetical protein [Labilibaculum manganireducens]